MNSRFGRPWLLIPGLIVVLALCIETVSAEPLQADLRFQPSRDEAIWVGEQIELNLDLLSDGFSFSGQRFLLPQVNGAYLLQADSSTVNLSERRGNETWQGLRYTILMFPQKAGLIEVPSFQVEFSVSAGYGSEPTSFQIDTQPLEIEVSLPPGAEPGGLVVTSTDFTMKYSWTPDVLIEETLQPKVGDALILKVERTAEAVPGMVFSPLPEFSIDGLQADSIAPEVHDRMNRGELRGSRSDSVTFICEREGSYEIPPINFQWWDPVNEVMKEEVIPGASLEVVANPAFLTADEFDDDQSMMARFSSRDLLILLAVFMAVAFGLWRASGLVRKRVNVWRLEREASETWAFRRAMKACQAGKASEAYQDINRWLTRFEGAGLTLLSLAQESGRLEFIQESEKLQSTLIAGGTSEWSGKGLAAELERFRSRNKQGQQLKASLPPLNP